METKECIVCGGEFEFKNSSKKTCSDKCRQQLSRDKKKKRKKINLNQDTRVIQDHYKSEFESMEVEIYCAAIERILSFCNKESVHISELQFLDDIGDILKSYSDRDEEFSAFYELLDKMLSVANDRADEDGYIAFKTKAVKHTVKELKHLLRTAV